MANGERNFDDLFENFEKINKWEIEKRTGIPALFDFTDECIEKEAYRNLKGYDKYFEYKIEYANNDPDTASHTLQAIYKILWAGTEKKPYMISGTGWIFSDTMTSVQHTLSKYFEWKFPDQIKAYKAEHKKQRYVSVKMCKDMYDNYGIKEDLERNGSLKRFVSVYHTLGNYIPVPAGFNTARSGYLASYDYWDLTIMKIKEYYDNGCGSTKNKAVLGVLELLHCKDSVCNCIEWLSSYDGWRDFIEKNYLQDFVQDFEKGNLEPIPFCKSHNWEQNEVKPEEYDEFFETVAKLIIMRNKRLLTALKEAM